MGISILNPTEKEADTMDGERDPGENEPGADGDTDPR
jgi:hypothetical protein